MMAQLASTGWQLTQFQNSRRGSQRSEENLETTITAALASVRAKGTQTSITRTSGTHDNKFIVLGELPYEPRYSQIRNTTTYERAGVEYSGTKGINHQALHTSNYTASSGTSYYEGATQTASSSNSTTSTNMTTEQHAAMQHAEMIQQRMNGRTTNFMWSQSERANHAVWKGLVGEAFAQACFEYGIGK